MTVRNTHISRRTALGSIATAGGLALGGVGLLAAGSDSVSADVTMQDLSVGNTRHESPEGTPADLWLLVSGDVTWESDADLPDGYQVDLELATSEEQADADNFDRVGRTSGRLMTYSGLANYQVRGRATEHVNLSASDVAATEAGTETVTDLWVRVVAHIQQGDETLIEAKAADHAQLTVANSSVAIDVGVSGDGSLAVQRNSTDATPTFGS